MLLLLPLPLLELSPNAQAPTGRRHAGVVLLILKVVKSGALV